MARYSAFLDACVLVPISLADTLLRLAGRVIMAALSGLYEQRRFLGGHDARVDGWEYHDRSDGDVAHFTGREWISADGSAPVYELAYHGGLVRPGPA